MTRSVRLTKAGVAGALVAAVTIALLTPFLTRSDRDDARSTLAEYTAERAEAQYGLFDALIATHQAGVSQFTRLFDGLDQSRVDALLELHFPMHDSGVRRGRDIDFDGGISDDGTLTYGMASFLGGEAHDAVARRASVAGFLTVRGSGPAIKSQFDNFYFNDERRLFIYAPDRPDRLMFYRHEAPASFSFAEHDFIQIVQPGANPLGRTVCTPLTDLLYARDQRALTIGCHTPVRINGRHLGAFGTTLPVAGFLSGAVNDPSGREAFVVSRDGRIVAHPALFQSSVITDQDVARVSADLDLQGLTSTIIANGRMRGIINDPATGGFAAFAKLEAPGWYLVIREPLAPSPWGAWLMALLIGVMAGSLVTFQLLLLPAKRGPQKAAVPS